MHGRKKHLLDSCKATGDLPTGPPPPPLPPAPPSSHHVGDMSALNLNQPLTEQLTQVHRRSHVDGSVPTPSRRTPVRASPDAAGSAPMPPMSSSTRMEVDVEPRCGRTSPSPARGPRRSRDPTAADEPPKPPGSRPTRSPDQGALGQAAFPPGIDPLAARMALQHQLGLFQHPALHPPPTSFLLPPDSGMTHNLELLYRVKYPRYPVPPPWLLYQYQDELIRDAAVLQQQAAASERLEHGQRERERADNDKAAIKDRQDRERRELDRMQQEQRAAAAAAAAERERRTNVRVKSSHSGGDMHPDSRKMQTEQQQQQQEQRRERERALIVDKATAGCVADAVNQHFQESLKHVEQKSYVTELSWLPRSAGGVPNSSAFVSPLQKSPIDHKVAPPDLIASSQQHLQNSVAAGYGVKPTDKLKYEDKMAADDRAKYSPRLHFDERTRMKLEDQRMRYEAEERARFEERMKAEDRQRYANWRELDAKVAEERRYEDRKRLAVKEEQWFHRDERLKNEERSRYERTTKYEEQRLIGPSAERADFHREMRPRPAHNGDGLYDPTKHRESPAAHRSGPPPAQLQQGPTKAPAAPGRGQEMNFNLYGYLPYNPMYISHERLNHALASPSKEDPSRAPRPGPPLDPADEGSGKPTSVIVEHRTPRHQPPPITVDPYRCRGSITHGTAASVKPVTTAVSLRQGAGPVASIAPAVPPMSCRDDARWSKKPTCVVNGLCWTGSQTVTSVGRPASPPNKVDLISQGLVPNPLYSSAAGGGLRGVIDLLPKPAVAGLDYAVDMSAKRPGANRFEAQVKRSRCDDLPVCLGQVQGQGTAPCLSSSYMDSFKSFVDHAVQSAFMDDMEGRNARPTGSEADQSKAAVASMLRSLTASPRIQQRNMPPPEVANHPSAPRSDVRMVLDQLGRIPMVGAQSSYDKLVATTAAVAVQPLASPSQMPSLVASGGVGHARLTSASPATVNHGPPLLVPQCPLDPVDDRSVADSPASSAVAGSEKLPGRSGCGGGGDTDSDTLSAHSPAPVLIPASTSPPPMSATASASLHLKKNWLLRYSDEDRKNTSTTMTTTADTFSAAESYEKQPDTAAATDDKSADVWTTKQNFDEGCVSDSDSKPTKAGSETQLSKLELEKKGPGKSSLGGNCEETEDGKSVDGKDAIKNCFINCAYLSDKDPDSRSLRRVAKDSAVEDKDAQSSTSKESDDSQSGSTRSLKRKSSRAKKTSDVVPAKKAKSWSSMASRTSSPCPSANSKASSQCGDEDEVPPKKQKQCGKSGSASQPSSDCELKIATRLKELKGKVRIGSLVSVLENKPLNRCTSEARRRKSREPFVQDGPCYDVTPKLMKCRECKLSQGQRNGSIAGSQLANNIFCRFYAFRKLCYSAKGLVSVSGFCKPLDADADDIELWLPVANGERLLNVDTAKYVISLLSATFTQLLDEENKASGLDARHSSKVVWKRAIQGVREMCDACDATLFNVHWTCGKCGFAVCADCYRAKRVSPPTKRDSVEWMTCSANRQIHEPDSLMSTQIIPSDVLSVLGRMLCDVMAKWHIAGGDWFHRQPPLPTLNGLRAAGPRTPKNRKKRLVKEDDEQTGPGTPQSSTNESTEVVVPSKENGIDGCVNGDSLDVDDEGDAGDRSGRSTRLLDHGRLLRLSETRITTEDLSMFQQHWQNSMPVLVTRPGSWFRSDIWRPAALARCGGSPAVDGVTGVDVPAARFWDQFEHGLKGASTLRLKDWPCADDLLAFTAHLRDLDERLPLPEYTRTTGALHLVSHVPEYFVRPELSVLRLHAGQSSTVCGQVAPLTKLRVDAVDNVSAVVYVNEKDDESQKHVAAALEMASCEKLCNKSSEKPIAVVWHVFRPQDADRIRSFVDKVSGTASSRSDSGTDSSLYLDAALRARLLTEHAVQCCTIVQCLGDIVLVPAMSPYQICAIQNCVLASREFISPESLRYSQCSPKHARASATGTSAGFEDQLQSKNLVYHAVKNSVATLQHSNP